MGTSCEAAPPEPVSGADPTDEARWAAVIARDAGADGAFLFAVTTTGVYCRPSCAARQPLRRNVRFYADAAAARADGFRPCRRCRPDGADPRRRIADTVAAACRRLDAADSPVALRVLAAEAGLSPHYFQRRFKAITGLTPRQYQAARREDQLRATLPGAHSVTTAYYDAGFGSSGRFYARAEDALGMAPARYRAGGLGCDIRYASAPCSLGVVLAAATTLGLCAILLGDDGAALEAELRRRFSAATLAPADDGFGATLQAVVALVDAPGRGFDLPVDIQGTAFQRQVWQALQTIPPGETRSYGEIAAMLGRPGAARAVGRACATNTLAVAVPCHRAVAADGGLTGYRWGVARKQALLQREAQAVDAARPGRAREPG